MGVKLALEGGCECEPLPQTSHPVLLVFKECALFSEYQESSQLDSNFIHSDRTVEIWATRLCLCYMLAYKGEYIGQLTTQIEGRLPLGLDNVNRPRCKRYCKVLAHAQPFTLMVMGKNR